MGRNIKECVHRPAVNVFIMILKLIYIIPKCAQKTWQANEYGSGKITM